MDQDLENIDVQSLKRANQTSIAELREGLLGLENMELQGRVTSSCPDNATGPRSARGDSMATSSEEFLRMPSAAVVRLLNEGVSTSTILARLAAAAEAVAGPGAVVSILVLDKDGLLRNAASPNLPADYLSAISGLKPDSRVGTCAAAAATGCVVITPDFFADDKWAELRHLPMALGFLGAWSVPVKLPEGKVLGTFGTYFRERRSPSPEERRTVPRLANAAALVLARIAEDCSCRSDQ